MRLADPDVASNNTEYQKIAKSLAELEEIYQTYQKFKECEIQLQEAKGKLAVVDAFVIVTGHLCVLSRSTFSWGFYG